VSGWTECSMLWSGLLILIYVTCRMKCESLQSIGCFFLYPAFWLVLCPGFWMAIRPEMATFNQNPYIEEEQIHNGQKKKYKGQTTIYKTYT
jgi:uncharacterized protein YneF (UPF0154 family)